MTNYKGQCFCYPTKDHGECEHCNRARQLVDRDVLCLANELAEEIDIDTIENLYKPVCPLCGSDDISEPLEDYNPVRKCDGCGKAFEDSETESEPRDIMQWFLVTNWLYSRLRELAEPVADWKGQYWWGRTCCGQGIELDGTFQKISRALSKGDNDA